MIKEQRAVVDKQGMQCGPCTSPAPEHLNLRVSVASCQVLMIVEDSGYGFQSINYESSGFSSISGLMGFLFSRTGMIHRCLGAL
ncbi:hypothetical protein GPALN_010743 [Globodera pallida]|nr:hypothetical protein GPALN_010743 [Globodera pallida]